jgi:hydrogenase/urease accessory protein HupE
MVEDALDVVIGKEKIVIDARITMEEILLVGAIGRDVTPDQWAALAREHGPYLLKHLRIRVDGQLIAGHVTVLPFPDSSPTGSRSQLAPYRLEYPLAAPPNVVLIDQNLLREYEQWTASCILRVRQSDQPKFDTDLLQREKSAEFVCEWTNGASTQPAGTTQPAQTEVKLGPTILAYTRHGIMHILTGYDHLLFVSALVLAATRFWDLIKVVTTFTVAHTLTLMLSVFNLVTLSEHIVEPMIAASIVFVAVQNVFWPRQSRGWTRLAIAFGFGLFHGLGFAGGLKEAMSEMPRIALWAALCAFSLGVEIGHQVVVIPLFTALRALRRGNHEEPNAQLSDLPTPVPSRILSYSSIRESPVDWQARLLKFGSCAISLAGMYYLVQALRPS